jgi:hypothetical protein
MKIYKFKDFNKEDDKSYFIDIVLTNTIWCARPDSLNDKDEEFKIELDYKESPDTARLLSELVARKRTTNDSLLPPPHVSVSLALKNEPLESYIKPTIESMIEGCRNAYGITSYSSTPDDYLWKEYGGNGNGVCVEINIPDHLIGKSYHWVQYVPDKILHVDLFLEWDICREKAYRDIFLTKTTKWKQEKEIRFIGNAQGEKLNINGHISEVIFGPYVDSHTLEKLKGQIADHCKANKIKITEK